MRFNGIMASAVHGATAMFSGATATLRRNAILYSLCAFCGVAAIVFAASASVLALEPHVGVIYARLILAGVFAMVVVAIVLGLWLARQPAPTTAAAQMPLHAQTQAAQRSAQFAQLAMIVEAVLLGYSMARRR
jgi:hypothetical protein